MRNAVVPFAGVVLLFAIAGCADNGSAARSRNPQGVGTSSVDAGTVEAGTTASHDAGTGDMGGGGGGGIEDAGLAPRGGENGVGGEQVEVTLPPLPANCETPESPLRRLSRFEYDNTVEHLLGVTGSASQALELDPASKFGNEATAIGLTLKAIDGYRAAASAVAKQAAPDNAAAAVTAACATLSQSCGAPFITSFGERAFRRPVTATERADLQALFNSGFAAAGLAGGVRVVIEAALQYPAFLYRIEASPVGVLDVVPSSWEMASRLSYLLWASMPDAALFDAARANELQTKDQVLFQARRMIEDPKARRQVGFFHSRNYSYSNVELLERNPVAYPTWVQGTATQFRRETDAFVAHIAVDLEGPSRTSSPRDLLS